MKTFMAVRDYDYIEARLSTPDMPTLEARGRLLQTGDTELANQLMEAAKAYNDEIVKVRLAFRERYSRGAVPHR